MFEKWEEHIRINDRIIIDTKFPARHTPPKELIIVDVTRKWRPKSPPERCFSQTVTAL